MENYQVFMLAQQAVLLIVPDEIKKVAPIAKEFFDNPLKMEDLVRTSPIPFETGIEEDRDFLLRLLILLANMAVLYAWDVANEVDFAHSTSKRKQIILAPHHSLPILTPRQLTQLRRKFRRYLNRVAKTTLATGQINVLSWLMGDAFEMLTGVYEP